MAASGLRTERAQAGWHRVPAVLLHDAPATAGSLTDPVPWPLVTARWASPAGPRTGTVVARPGARAGSVVMVWIDRPGKLTGPPQPAATVTYQVFLTALAVPVALSLVLLAVWVYTEMILN